LIRVLLVDDSPVAIAVLKRMLAKSPEIAVVGTASNGREGLELIPQVKPDVICTDLHMPIMDGLEFTREVMAKHPKPILLVSVSAYESSLSAFKVIEAGAVDLFSKPLASFELDYEITAPQLIQKIKILSGVRVFRRPRVVPAGVWVSEKSRSIPAIQLPKSPVRIVIVGASTGGPQALQTVLARLPADFPLPIICIQHINEGFLQGLVDWLSSQCRMKVEVARGGGSPCPARFISRRKEPILILMTKVGLLYRMPPPLTGIDRQSQ
jgi:two-component system chemotaxis response regulator CheB